MNKNRFGWKVLGLFILPMELEPSPDVKVCARSIYQTAQFFFDSTYPAARFVRFFSSACYY